jgi:hypothetical protein
MMRAAKLVSCLALTMLLNHSADAEQVQLPPGNGIWLKPSATPVAGNEATLVSTLHTRDIKHVFLWLVSQTSTDYAQYAPFIRHAQSNAMTVHAVCATKTSISSNGELSTNLLAVALNHVTVHNANHPTAKFDGVQVDIEGVTGATLTNLLSAVRVPESLVFSAAVQPDEYYPDVEAHYSALLENTDVDVLIPMIYIMDGVWYSQGNASFTFTLPRVQSKTAQLLAKLPPGGRMMTGVSAYDRQYPVSKATGAIDWTFLANANAPDGFSQPAFSTHPTSRYSVPNLINSNKPLVSVSYRTNTGVSIYRFDFDAERWFDVLETNPSAVRQSISRAHLGGTNDARYLGACAWLHSSIFDPYSGRGEGFVTDDNAYPIPTVSIELLSFRSGLARLRVNLTNANPSERILGDHSAAGVHLRLDGAAFFVSADNGEFHAVEGFNSSGALLTNVNGAQIIELRRSFFENPAAQHARSGEIVVDASSLLNVRYRAWMTDKDSLSTNAGVAMPYVARSPGDVPYHDPARFLTLATFLTTLIPETPPTDFELTPPRFLPDGTAELRLNCVSGWPYAIQVSTNLLDWDTTFVTNANSESVLWLDPNAVLFDRRFYRARLQY